MRFIAVLFVMLVWALPALAHPHIWIDARSVVIFDASGAVSAIRHEWTFDEAFSAWSIQGLDVDGDGKISDSEFQELARQNMEGLAEYDYYTFAGIGATDIAFHPVEGAHLVFDGNRTTLTFELRPDQPIHVAGTLEIEVTDPEYYAAFSFVDGGASVENAPAGCSVEVNPPKEIAPELAQRLSDLGSDITVLPPDLKRAAEDLANALIVRCDGTAAPAATTAVQAIEKMSSRSAAPFMAPPTERGLPAVRTGVLGWVFKLQQSFYGALTKALGQLKSDGNAFWVLGSLSFLYGVFHAAGPGHGKVVISSYMLAAKADARRGVSLSFVSAMVQSLTAIIFVGVAAMVLNLTSTALSESANILVIGSYVLVILLGVWLVVRKIFGLGYGHHGHAAHDDDHHDHDHAEAHIHAITPDLARGDWREMLGVVLAVGLRPCSGALVVLVFALSQGVFMAGVAAVFLMGIGTALSVAILAMLAVGLKGAAGLLSGGRFGALAASVVWWLELFGAFAVLGFGVVLLLANI